MNKIRRLLITAFSAMFLVCATLFAVACGGTKMYSVTTNYEASQGTVTLSPSPNEEGKYEEHTEITVTVKANSGYEVDSFTVSTDSNAKLSNGSYTFTIESDTSISATFKSTGGTVTPQPKTYTVSVNAPRNGTITLDKTDGKYEENKNATVTVTPNAGYEVDTFTVGGTDQKANLKASGSAFTYTFKVTADTQVAVAFKSTGGTVTPEPKTYTVSVTAPQNGTVTLDKADGKYEENANATVTVTPNAGYEVDTFTVGGTDQKANLKASGSAFTYTFKVTADTQVAATFKLTEVFPENYRGTWVYDQKEIVITATTLEYDGAQVSVTKTDSGFTFTVGKDEDAVNFTIVFVSAGVLSVTEDSALAYAINEEKLPTGVTYEALAGTWESTVFTTVEITAAGAITAMDETEQKGRFLTVDAAQAKFTALIGNVWYQGSYNAEAGTITLTTPVSEDAITLTRASTSEAPEKVAAPEGYAGTWSNTAHKIVIEEDGDVCIDSETPNAYLFEDTGWAPGTYGIYYNETEYHIDYMETSMYIGGLLPAEGELGITLEKEGVVEPEAPEELYGTWKNTPAEGAQAQPDITIGAEGVFLGEEKLTIESVSVYDPETPEDQPYAAITIFFKGVGSRSIRAMKSDNWKTFTYTAGGVDYVYTLSIEIAEELIGTWTSPDEAYTVVVTDSAITVNTTAVTDIEMLEDGSCTFTWNEGNYKLVSCSANHLQLLKETTPDEEGDSYFNDFAYLIKSELAEVTLPESLVDTTWAERSDEEDTLSFTAKAITATKHTVKLLAYSDEGGVTIVFDEEVVSFSLFEGYYVIDIYLADDVSYSYLKTGVEAVLDEEYRGTAWKSTVGELELTISQDGKTVTIGGEECKLTTDGWGFYITYDEVTYNFTKNFYSTNVFSLDSENKSYDFVKQGRAALEVPEEIAGQYQEVRNDQPVSGSVLTIAANGAATWKGHKVELVDVVLDDMLEQYVLILVVDTHVCTVFVENFEIGWGSESHSFNKINYYTVTVTLEGDEDSVTWDLTPNKKNYKEGDSVSIKFLPATGYEISSVTIDGEPLTLNATNRGSFTVTANVEIVITMVKKPVIPSELHGTWETLDGQYTLVVSGDKLKLSRGETVVEETYTVYDEQTPLKITFGGTEYTLSRKRDGNGVVTYIILTAGRTALYFVGEGFESDTIDPSLYGDYIETSKDGADVSRGDTLTLSEEGIVWNDTAAQAIIARGAQEYQFYYKNEFYTVTVMASRDGSLTLVVVKDNDREATGNPGHPKYVKYFALAGVFSGNDRVVGTWVTADGVYELVVANQRSAVISKNGTEIDCEISLSAEGDPQIAFEGVTYAVSYEVDSLTTTRAAYLILSSESGVLYLMNPDILAALDLSSMQGVYKSTNGDTFTVIGKMGMLNDIPLYPLSKRGVEITFADSEGTRYRVTVGVPAGSGNREDPDTLELQKQPAGTVGWQSLGTLTPSTETYTLDEAFNGNWVAADDGETKLVIAATGVTLGGVAFKVAPNNIIYSDSASYTVAWYGYVEGKVIALSAGTNVTYFVADSETPTAIAEKYNGTWYYQYGQGTLVIDAAKGEVTFDGVKAAAVVSLGSNFTRPGTLGDETVTEESYYFFIVSEEEVTVYYLSWYVSPSTGEFNRAQDNPTVDGRPYIDEIYVDELLIGTWKGADGTTTIKVEDGKIYSGETELTVYNFGGTKATGNLVVLNGKLYSLVPDSAYETILIMEEQVADDEGIGARSYFLKEGTALGKVTSQDLLNTTWENGMNALTIGEDGSVTYNESACAIWAITEGEGYVKIVLIINGDRVDVEYMGGNFISVTLDGVVQQFTKKSTGETTIGFLGLPVGTLKGVNNPYATVTVTADSLTIKDDNMLAEGPIVLTIDDLTEAEVPAGYTGTKAYTFTATLNEVEATCTLIIDGVMGGLAPMEGKLVVSWSDYSSEFYN